MWRFVCFLFFEALSKVVIQRYQQNRHWLLQGELSKFNNSKIKLPFRIERNNLPVLPIRLSSKLVHSPAISKNLEGLLNWSGQHNNLMHSSLGFLQNMILVSDY